LAEARGNEAASEGGTDRLACTGLGENDVPEIHVWLREGNADKTMLTLFPQGSDVTFDGFASHLIEHPDGLPRDKGRIHKQERSMGADNVRGGLQVDRFAFGETATNLQWDLKGQANRTAPFWVSRSMHMRAFGEGLKVLLRMLPRMWGKDKFNKDLGLSVLKR